MVTTLLTSETYIEHLSVEFEMLTVNHGQTESVVDPIENLARRTELEIEPVDDRSARWQVV